MVLSEEQVTIAIIKQLRHVNWHIVSFDFPQSGTGRALIAKGNGPASSRRRVVPDVIAVRNEICLILENKHAFDINDVRKLEEIRDSGRYNRSLESILRPYRITNFIFGIGLPIADGSASKELIVPALDVLLAVDESLGVRVLSARNNTLRDHLLGRTEGL